MMFKISTGSYKRHPKYEYPTTIIIYIYGYTAIHWIPWYLCKKMIVVLNGIKAFKALKASETTEAKI